MKRKRVYPITLAGAVFTTAALLWAVGQAQGQTPKAIPVPVYKIESTYSSAGDTLTETRRVRPTNLPATAKSWWIVTVTPIVHIVVEGGDLYVFPWKGGPSPDPKPDPKPDPVPPPPLPTELWCIVIEESAKRTPQQGIVLASPKVRTLFPVVDGLRLFDPIDDQGKRRVPPPELKLYVDRVFDPVQPLTMPVCFLVAKTGQVYYQDALPATVDAMTVLVDKIKKGGAQ